jgi:UDPglucose 6-dehydrogenase
LKVLMRLGKEYGFETPVIDGVWRVNQRQNGVVVRKLEKIYGSVKDLTIGVLGLTYKAGTSTLRRSAALEIIRELNDKGAKIKAYDPKADIEEVLLHREFEFCQNAYEVARGSDALVIITEWPEFKELDFARIKSVMKKPVLIDAKNILDAEQLTGEGFIYAGIGRGQKL